MSDKKEYLFKTLVIGEPGAGKSSIIKQYVDGIFKHGYLFTIGVDFALKVVDWTKNETVRLQLWDVAGQERFGVMTRVYYKEANACVIVFDITQRRTFQAVIKWKKDLDSKVHLPNGEPIPCLLLANKCDLKSRPVSDEEIDALVKDNGFIGWFSTSAKDNINIDKAMRMLIQNILSGGVFVQPTNKAQNNLNIPSEEANPDQQKGSCCN
eukprot:Lithocolla_globosa_v1_NODE_9534_length_694_cov_6.644757.p1 type:complete len:210 gc:universal NODE_9534_length_694_cov_6.644757:637-8(-)